MTRPHNAYLGTASPGYEWATERHWDDLPGSESQGAAGAALTYAAFRDTPFKLFSFRNAQNDELHLRFQLPHGWDPTSDINFHLHTVPLTDPAGAEAVRFTGQYTWVGGGEEVPANAGWTQFAYNFPLAPGDLNKQKVALLFTATPPAHATESEILLVYLKRVGGDAADTYLGNLAVMSLDVHMQRVKLGTLNEYPGQG